jgi:hypothetical protein
MDWIEEITFEQMISACAGFALNHKAFLYRFAALLNQTISYA